MPHMILQTNEEIKISLLVSYLVATDGSLLLFIGIKIYVDCEQKSNNTTQTPNNTQSVHVSASFKGIFPT